MTLRPSQRDWMNRHDRGEHYGSLKFHQHREPIMLPQNRWMTYYKYRWLIRVVVALLVGVLLVYVFKGCSAMERESTLNQKQLENNSGKTAADIANAAKITPPDMTITTTAKDGTKVQIVQPVASSSTSNASVNTDEKASFKASGTWEWAESMPAAVKWLIGAIAIGLLIAIVQYLRKNFVSVNKAVEWTDEEMAKGIHKVRNKVMTLTDPHQIAEMTTLAADLERDRTDFHKT